MRHAVKGSGILLLHGYLLEGSGSNLWTRAIVRSLCRIGEVVHLVCQENHPELYEFIAEARLYHPDGTCERVLERETPYRGTCILHKPVLGETLPVYVEDRYEEFSRVVPMIDLPEPEIEEYLRRNIEVVMRVASENPVHAIHANHAVLMPQVAEAVSERTGLPFTIMPHGSAIEYAVKRDERFRDRAQHSFDAADTIFVIGPEMRERVRTVFDGVEGLTQKMAGLNLGVDTGLFEPVPPGLRSDAMLQLSAELADVERGRAPADRAVTAAALAELGGRSRDAAERHDALVRLLAEPEGDQKNPDAGVEDLLRSIDFRSEPVILFVGRLIAAKGPHAVLAAFPEILRSAPDARLVIVGHGPLRLPLEAMVAALANGDRPLFEALLRPGMPGADVGLPEVRAFLDELDEAGRRRYFDNAAETLTADRVIFTGYLKHRELRYLFPCCDIAIFPSLVREAGPLVFLEALASGCLPLGTDFGGMAQSLAALEDVLPPETLDAARLTAQPERLVADIAAGAPAALAAARQHAEDLRRIAVERYDWASVAKRFAERLRELGT